VRNSEIEFGRNERPIVKNELGAEPRRVLDDAIGSRQPPIEADGPAELCAIALFPPARQHDALPRKVGDDAVAPSMS
jgi:hypothetical protein